MLRTWAACAVSLFVGCSDRPLTLLDGDGGSGGSGDGASAQGAGSNNGGSSAGGDGQGGDAPQPASFELSLDEPSPSVDLRAEVEVDVTIEPNGYTGAVALALSGVPDDVDAALASTSVVLDGQTAETVTVTFTTASDTTTGTFPFTVTGTVEAGDKSTAGTLAVIPAITITIPANLAAMQPAPGDPPNQTAFGPYPTVLKALPNMSAQNTITIRFFNADTVPHEIHADNADQGFPHGNQSIPPMSFDPVVRNVNSPGQYDYYPHDLGVNNIQGRILIQ